MKTQQFNNLKEAGNSTYVAFGYIRHVQDELFPNHTVNPQYTIPDLIIFLCLSYFHIADCFDVTNCASTVEISGHNNNTIAKIKENSSYTSTKNHCLNWIKSTEPKIVKWKLKGSFKKLSIHIIPSKIPSYRYNHYNGKYWTYKSFGWMQSPFETSGTAYRFTCDDEVDIILDLENAQFKCEIDGKYKDIIADELPKADDIDYQLAITLHRGGDCVTLLNHSEDYII